VGKKQIWLKKHGADVFLQDGILVSRWYLYKFTMAAFTESITYLIAVKVFQAGAGIPITVVSTVIAWFFLDIYLGFQEMVANWAEGKKKQYYIVYGFIVLFVQIFIMPYLQEQGLIYTTKFVNSVNVKELPQKGAEVICQLKADIQAMVIENTSYYYKVCLVVYKDVERTTKLVAANNSLLDYKDVIFSYLIMDVISNLHKYNNPAYVGYAQGYSFDSFIRAYAKNAVRQAISEKTGLNKHQLAKANHVKKTIRLVALAKKISMDCVTIDDIFEYQGKVGDSLCLKKEVINEVLGYMNTPVHNDGMEEFDVPYMDSEYEESEKNETKELLRVFFDNLRSAQKYIFLQRCQSKEEGATVKQMAKNERLIALCLLDEVSKRNITVGNLSIIRPKGKTDAPQIERKDYGDR